MFYALCYLSGWYNDLVKNLVINSNNSQQGLDGVRKHKVRQVPSHRLIPFACN